MNDNLFFKPTPLFKEYMILDLIEKDSNITQRMMSNELGVAVSMINAYVDDYEDKGYIRRKYKSSKTVEYFITKKGKERKKLLNIWYLKSSHMIYQSAKDNIITFLNQIIDKGFKKILLYGAGEVAEIMLQVIHSDHSIPLDVLAVIDDDQEKINHTVVNTPVIGIEDIRKYQHNGILVSSYKHHEAIYKNLIAIDYPKDKIIHFFDN
ncbi:MAG: winged helix-turn-helix transcriptional regulator [Candidatus Izemoplasmataceae bacterium]